MESDTPESDYVLGSREDAQDKGLPVVIRTLERQRDEARRELAAERSAREVAILSAQEWKDRAARSATREKQNGIDVATALQMACTDIPPEFARVVDREFWNILNDSVEKGAEPT